MGSPPAPDFSGLISSIAGALGRRHIPFMLIGGQAVLLHGRPRLTEDIDVTLGVDITELPALRSVCEDLGLSLLPEEPEAFVHETFVPPTRHPIRGSGSIS
ncbi:MAG TPA: hypothetical protein VGA42_09705, partial [Gemmatimonadales bacterium]